VRHAAVAAVVLLATVLAPAAARHGEMRWEAAEGFAPGQRTCVPDALAPATSTCPSEPTVHIGNPVLHPPEGIRILDGFVAQTGVTSHPYNLVGDPTSNPDDARMTAQSVTSAAATANLQRETGGLVNVFLPGRVDFVAWLGPWRDDDADGEIDLRVVQNIANGFKGYAPGNEYVSLSIEAFAFVEPGSHPVTGDTTRPAEDQPDFQYSRPSSAVDRLYRTQAGVLFLDGNLLERYVVETVSEPILLGDETTGRPYTLRASSLVDIDRYAAVAPGPIETLYRATASPVVQAVNTPGIGLCPESCVFPPFPANDVAPVGGAVYSNYPLETEASDPFAAQPGRADDYKEAFHAWADVLPGYSPFISAVSLLPPRPYPLPGLGANGGLAVPPGALFLPDLWMGIWRDVNGDGVVGVGRPGDPYEGGNRPIPHRYAASTGEFLPDNGRSVPEGRFLFTLTPEATWGEPGVAVVSRSGSILAADNEDCPVSGHPSGRCFISGATPFSFRQTLQVQTGRWSTTHFLLFPEGTAHGGFTICIGPRLIEFRQAGIDVSEVVQDCDFVERLAT